MANDKKVESEFTTNDETHAPTEILSESGEVLPEHAHQEESPDEGQNVDTANPLQQELNAKVEELQVQHDKYLRLGADFENYKRRAQRDQSETARFANEKLLKDLLPTIDNLERAIKCGRESTSGDGFLEGVELTYKQFLDTLTKLGVSQISSVGEPFDPGKHQAVAQVPSDTTPLNAIVEEYQPGYFLYDRILRTAMVTVATAPSDQEPEPKGDTNPGQEGETA
jgi:molecular chaperone GrpE